MYGSLEALALGRVEMAHSDRQCWPVLWGWSLPGLHPPSSMSRTLSQEGSPSATDTPGSRAPVLGFSGQGVSTPVPVPGLVGRHSPPAPALRPPVGLCSSPSASKAQGPLGMPFFRSTWWVEAAPVTWRSPCWGTGRPCILPCGRSPKHLRLHLPQIGAPTACLALAQMRAPLPRRGGPVCYGPSCHHCRPFSPCALGVSLSQSKPHLIADMVGIKPTAYFSSLNLFSLLSFLD